MSNKFLTKIGVIINQIASDFLQLKKGDRMPSISEFQQKYGVARGTIQTALKYLKDEKAIVLKSKGHLGTFIEEIDYPILQEYALSEYILGTMTLPYSKLYEGLATGIYDEFSKHNSKLNLAYIRGSKERIRSIQKKMYRFAVVSKFAANQAISRGEPICISVDFGAKTYLSQHVLLFASQQEDKIDDGMRVAIDYSSLDHQLLTQMIVKEKNVELIEMPGHQIIHSLKAGIIDAGIWNFDEIKDKNYHELKAVLLENNNIENDLNTSVIICHEEDKSMQAFFDKVFDKRNVLTIQEKVKEGLIIPKY